MKINSVIIVASFLTLLAAFWNRNALPGSIDYVPGIEADPRQVVTRDAPFTARFNNINYRVEPEYRYDLTGMIVSYRHHDGKDRMHARASDHLNMLDVCVIWGDNTRNERLDKIDFWNGIFTCNVFTRDQQAWDAFRMDQLSNNHLLSDDEFIRDKVQAIRIGDQVRVRGWLASYDSPGGKRGTSTTRDDTGDGACETIYVEQFDIVGKATSNWRIAMYVALVLLLLSLANHFRQPYRPHAR